MYLRECDNQLKFLEKFSYQEKKSERKKQKRIFSLRISSEKRVTEMAEKDSSCEWAGEKEWEKKQKKILLVSEQRDREYRKKEGDGAPLIGAITRENSNLADRAPSKIVNLPAKNWHTKVYF